MRTMKLVPAVLGLALAWLAVGVSKVEAQSVPTSEAQAFLGEWNLSIEGTPLQIAIKDEGGSVAAEVSVMGTTNKAETISKAGEALTLKYTADLQGQQAPISIKLTPSGANLAAEIDVADGMFSATGTATKR